MGLPDFVNGHVMNVVKVRMANLELFEVIHLGNFILGDGNNLSRHEKHGLIIIKPNTNEIIFPSTLAHRKYS